MTARQIDMLLDDRTRLMTRNLLLRAELTKLEMWAHAAIKALGHTHPSHAQKIANLELAQQGRELLQEVVAVCVPKQAEGGAGCGEAPASPEAPPVAF